MAKKQGIVYVKPSEGFFTIPEVAYKGEKDTYQLFEQMTPVMTQAQLSETYEREKQKGNPYPIDASLIWAIVKRGYELKDKSQQEAERLGDFLKNGFRRFPNTLTKVIYSSGNDRVVHNCGTSDEYSSEGKIIGISGRIKQISDKKILELILGESDIDEINKISQWINGTDSYIWRLNKNPSQRDERVVGFGADSDGFYLSCGRGPRVGCPAFRALKVE